GSTWDAGDARFFCPPPFERGGSTAVQKFLNTAFEPTVKEDGAVKAERSKDGDVGLEQNLAKALTVGVDGYYKQAIHLIDEGQFGAPIILTPFNYRYGQVYGVEFTGQYNVSHFQAYGNLAFQRAIGKHFESSQF